MLGLFGGRFDPPHRAHVAMAQAAADQLGLQEVRWIVTGQPVHKPAEASAAHRLQMTAHALDALGDTRMRLDDREVRAADLGQPSATYRTIESIQREMGNRPLVWILGQDQFSHFTSWQHWDWLIRNMALAVCARPGAAECAEQAQLRARGAEILQVQIQPDEASSTWAREAIREGLLPEGLLPQVVADYIAEHRLYASDAKRKDSL